MTHTPIRFAEPTLHRRDDIFYRRDVGTVAVEDFVSERYTLLGHDQGDADLTAVGTMIAAVSSLGLWVRRCFPLEIGAGHVVQQQVVVELEELPQTMLQMLFERCLVGQQCIQSTIQPVVVHLLDRDIQNVFKRCLPIPVLGNV